MNKCERCQIRWERDQAMEQLEEHRIPFGCIADDVVKVVYCKDCEYFKQIDACFGECVHLPGELVNSLIWYCADGERKEE